MGKIEDVKNYPIKYLWKIFRPCWIRRVVFNDQVGPTSRGWAQISPIYHHKYISKYKTLFALSGGFTQFKIDKENWNVKTQMIL